MKHADLQCNGFIPQDTKKIHTDTTHMRRKKKYGQHTDILIDIHDIFIYIYIVKFCSFFKKIYYIRHISLPLS